LVPETALLVFALLAAGWLAVTPRNARSLLRATTVANALVSIYGIAQYFGVDPLLPAQAYQVGEGPFTIVRPPGTLGHADYFGAWLVAALFLAAALRRLESSARVRAVISAVMVLNVAAVLLTGTRSALLGVVAGGVVFMIADRTRLRSRSVVAILACVAGLALFLFSPPGAKLRARVHWSLEDARGGARLLLWRDSLRMAATRPLTGFGPETFGLEFPQFESRELARAYPDFYHESPHNLFLDALTAEGLAGLAPLLALCLLGMLAGARGLRNGNVSSAPTLAALAGLLFAQQFIVFTIPTALYFYVIVGLLVPSGAWATEAVEEAPRRRLWVFRGVAIILGLVFVALSIRLIAADAAFASAQGRIASGDASGAAQAYRRAMAWQVPGSSFDLEYSRAMQQLAVRASVPALRFLAEQQAVEAGLRAVRTSENPQNAWYNLAILLARNQDAGGVEHALRNAIAASPNWFKPHWALARLLSASGRREEALREAREARDLDDGHDAAVTETWEELSSAVR
jgi:O-antigen ligase